MVGIYKITSPTGRIYIGQSEDIQERWKIYKRTVTYNYNTKQPRLLNSFKKYGIDSHTFEVIEECKVEELDTKERLYQELFNVLGRKGLNCVLTGTEKVPKVLSESTKSKIRKKLKGIPCKHSPEGLLKIKENGKRIRSQEEREKLSKSLTGKPKSQSHRENLSKSTRGVNNHQFKSISRQQEELLLSLLEQKVFKKDMVKILGVGITVLNRWIKEVKK
jgi:group I intron endonuclease